MYLFFCLASFQYFYPILLLLLLVCFDLYIFFLKETTSSLGGGEWGGPGSILERENNIIKVLSEKLILNKVIKKKQKLIG